jgi:AcrR family transcriptional regulator
MSASPVASRVELLWGLRTGRRGRKAGLSVESIANAALQLADENGLAGVSMAKLAERLGRSTMGLYRYVTGKDELFELMADAALGEAPPVSPEQPWQSAIQDWAEAALVALRRHAWYAEVPIVAPPIGPRNLQWLEAGLQALRASGISEPDKVDLVLATITVVHGTIRLTPGPEGEMPNPPYGDQLREVLSLTTSPALATAVDRGAFDAPTDDRRPLRGTGFAASIQLVIAGAEARLTSNA